MAAAGCSKWLTPIAVAIAATLATVSVSTAISLYFSRKRLKLLGVKIKQLEITLNSSLAKCASERQGRIRAQKELRDALAKPKLENSKSTSYPMRPIGVVQSCFSTRNGTPRQPLLVTLARACLVFDSAQVPPASLEGVSEYSHCWVIYVFHLNTDLEKLWKQPSRSKFKAKVRVPRLKGGRMGVFATRSPHRPCPIGLTVAKVEAVRGNVVLVSGVDLVDGTPILDIKPYLPYSDSIHGATVPGWVKMDNMLAVASVNFSDNFFSSLVECWKIVGKKSLYASPHEFQSLIKQVLSWDIRSVSQRNHPHGSLTEYRNVESGAITDSSHNDDEANYCNNVEGASPPGDGLYHLILEMVDVSYRINSSGEVVVEKAVMSSHVPNSNQCGCSYLTWTGELN